MIWNSSTVEIRTIYIFRKYQGGFKILGIFQQGGNSLHWEPDYSNVMVTMNKHHAFNSQSSCLKLLKTTFRNATFMLMKVPYVFMHNLREC